MRPPIELDRGGDFASDGRIDAGNSKTGQTRPPARLPNLRFRGPSSFSPPPKKANWRKRLRAIDLAHGKAYPLVCWLLFWSWFLSLNFLSSIPIPEFAPSMDFQYMDKLAHFAAFSAGAFLLATAWTASKGGLPPLRFFLVFLFISLFGVADEIRQLLIPGRTGADAGDMAANALGALVGSYFSQLIHAHFLTPRKPR